MYGSTYHASLGNSGCNFSLSHFDAARMNSQRTQIRPKEKFNNANKETLKHNPHLSEIPSPSSIFEAIRERRKFTEYYRPPSPTGISK